ncbi:hypothetical protein CGRA01v4_09380 [Colletotrichum graminicola]|nr:hypothetical protein CGRA01v4_09380 [Colletotrichum graminicola]
MLRCRQQNRTSRDTRSLPFGSSRLTRPFPPSETPQRPGFGRTRTPGRCFTVLKLRRHSNRPPVLGNNEPGFHTSHAVEEHAARQAFRLSQVRDFGHNVTVTGHIDPTRHARTSRRQRASRPAPPSSLGDNSAPSYRYITATREDTMVALTHGMLHVRPVNLYFGASTTLHLEASRVGPYPSISGPVSQQSLRSQSWHPAIRSLTGEGIE